MSCGGKSNEDVPLIFAAASLADVLIESAELYETQTGMRVDFSFGGSIALANQIALLGAPADGVFFVGERPMAALEEANLLPSADRSIVAQPTQYDWTGDDVGYSQHAPESQEPRSGRFSTA